MLLTPEIWIQRYGLVETITSIGVPAGTVLQVDYVLALPGYPGTVPAGTG